MYYTSEVEEHHVPVHILIERNGFTEDLTRYLTGRTRLTKFLFSFINQMLSLTKHLREVRRRCLAFQQRMLEMRKLCKQYQVSVQSTFVREQQPIRSCEQQPRHDELDADPSAALWQEALTAPLPDSEDESDNGVKLDKRSECLAYGATSKSCDFSQVGYNYKAVNTTHQLAAISDHIDMVLEYLVGSIYSKEAIRFPRTRLAYQHTLSSYGMPVHTDELMNLVKLACAKRGLKFCLDDLRQHMILKFGRIKALPIRNTRIGHTHEILGYEYSVVYTDRAGM